MGDKQLISALRQRFGTWPRVAAAIPLSRRQLWVIRKRVAAGESIQERMRAAMLLALSK